ncbi:MAG: hypothetical protein ABIX28_01600 [Vicinamibacterales bacterium]
MAADARKALEAIRTLYFASAPATIQRDFDRAIDILKTLPTDEDREKAAVYMEGLAEMRQEWKGRQRPPR